MSKLRIIGGALIVLFLFTIIALAVIAVNFVNLSNQQTQLAKDVADIKNSLTADNNAAGGTVLTGTDTNVGPADEPTNNGTTSTPSESINQSTSQTCTNTTLAIKATVPSDWSCEDTGNPSNSGQSYLILKKGNAQLSIGTPASGFNCVNNDCTTTYLIDNETNRITVTSENGEVVNISGHSSIGTGPGLNASGLQINLRIVDTSTTLDAEFNKNKNDIINIVNSLAIL